MKQAMEMIFEKPQSKRLKINKNHTYFVETVFAHRTGMIRQILLRRSTP